MEKKTYKGYCLQTPNGEIFTSTFREVYSVARGCLFSAYEWREARKLGWKVVPMILTQA